MKTALYIFGIIILSLATIITVNMCSTAATVATAPGRVLKKTLETDNIVNNYEWYYDAKASYDGRLSQVQQFKKMYSKQPAGGNASDHQRLLFELAAIQQSCRELAQGYNANSQKLNRKIFKGWSLPETLAAGACE